MRNALALSVVLVMLTALAVDTITVTGDISFHPDPRGLWIAPAEYEYPDGQPDCEANDKGSCLALDDCTWVVDPRGPPPSGEPPYYCVIANPPHVSPPPLPDMIGVRLDGIDLTNPASVFAILVRYDTQGPSKTVVDGGMLGQGQDVTEIQTPFLPYSPGRVDVSICLNTTSCPSWDEDCSTCRSERLMIHWIDGENGGPSNLSAIPASTWFTVPIRGDPSLWEDEVERVRATFNVMALTSQWWTRCQLLGMDDENSVTVDLCQEGGSLTPDVCQPREPTGMEGQEVGLVITPPSGGWRAGRYEVMCNVSVKNYVDVTTNHIQAGFDVLRQVPPRGKGGTVMTVFIVLGLAVAVIIWRQDEGPSDPVLVPKADVNTKRKRR